MHGTTTLQGQPSAHAIGRAAASRVPSAKGSVLLLLAFLLPLAFYLLVLGVLNRRPHPLLVSGVWDFIGLLFAASGFLLFGGPGILGGLNERWRMYWLLGQPPGGGGPSESGWQFWVFLSVLYFVLVVTGSAYLLFRRRHLTAIYNVDPAAAEEALAEVCQGLGVQPVRSGNLFLFGIVVGRAPRFGVREGIQAPHYLPADGREALPRTASAPASPGPDLVGQAAILEVDPFPLMNHVTLRWDPPDPPLRREVEAALARRLAETPAPDSELGGWLLVLGFSLLCLTTLTGLVLFLIYLFQH